MGMLHFFFFNDTATTEIYTLSLHDALPICSTQRAGQIWSGYLTEVQEINTTFARRATETWIEAFRKQTELNQRMVDRKSTRLNSSHANISYAVFCLKKKTTLTQFSYHLSHS